VSEALPWIVTGLVVLLGIAGAVGGYFFGRAKKADDLAESFARMDKARAREAEARETARKAEVARALDDLDGELEGIRERLRMGQDPRPVDLDQLRDRLRRLRLRNEELSRDTGDLPRG
jgi:hypothetical protein